MKVYSKYFAVLALVLFPQTGIPQDGGRAPVPVSFVEILANPERLDGQLIVVTGFLGLDPPDGDMLFLHKEDYDHGILWNGVGIELSREAWAAREKLDLNYVRVIGIFESGKKSRNQVGAITKIQKCFLWSQISGPIRGGPSSPRNRKPK